MCAINGIIDPNAVAPAQRLSRIAAMNRALAHRGPDGSGEFVDEGVALGHRRLSIVDLSDAGSQPMFNEDGNLVLIFNGEIYNHAELRPVLQAAGHVFRSNSDSEVILHAYEQWGEACVERFYGMWGFAIWDRRRHRLFLSRDRLGVKPVCYWQRGSQLIFSSETAGIRAAQPIHQADRAKLFSFLAYGYRTTDGQSFFDGIRELPPGHNAVFESGKLRLRRYWALPENDNSPPEHDRVTHLRELLVDAVRMRFQCDVPVALLQSGGLDSSAICAVVNDEIEAGRLGVQSVTAFTAVHPGHLFDERPELHALMASCPHVVSVELEPDAANLVMHLPRFVAAMQEPQFSSTSFVHWCLMREVAARGVKVVINGQGADEALAGYGRYVVGQRLLDLLQTKPLSAWREARAMHRRLGYGPGLLASQLAKAMLGRRAASAWRARHSEKGWSVLAADFLRDHKDDLPEVGMVGAGRNLDNHLRSQLLHYGFGQILHYEDQSSMSHGIEIRSPFIDHRLMAFAFGLPSADKLSDGITKRILRCAFAHRLPGCIVNNHQKIGFATPFEEWSRQPAFRDFVRDIVHSDEFRNRRVWNAARLSARLLDPASVARGFPVWRFIQAELWFRSCGITNV